eukprot:scaffold2145_cov309-Prasinococcus_capsulatus_cf.AAC.11
MGHGAQEPHGFERPPAPGGEEQRCNLHGAHGGYLHVLLKAPDPSVRRPADSLAHALACSQRAPVTTAAAARSRCGSMAGGSAAAAVPGGAVRGDARGAQHARGRPVLLARARLRLPRVRAARLRPRGAHARRATRAAPLAPEPAAAAAAAGLHPHAGAVRAARAAGGEPAAAAGGPGALRAAAPPRRRRARRAHAQRARGLRARASARARALRHPHAALLGAPAAAVPLGGVRRAVLGARPTAASRRRRRRRRRTGAELGWASPPLLSLDLTRRLSRLVGAGACRPGVRPVRGRVRRAARRARARHARRAAQRDAGRRPPRRRGAGVRAGARRPAAPAHAGGRAHRARHAGLRAHLARRRRRRRRHGCGRAALLRARAPAVLPRGRLRGIRAFAAGAVPFGLLLTAAAARLEQAPCLVQGERDACELLQQTRMTRAEALAVGELWDAGEQPPIHARGCGQLNQTLLEQVLRGTRAMAAWARRSEVVRRPRRRREGPRGAHAHAHALTSPAGLPVCAAHASLARRTLSGEPGGAAGGGRRRQRWRRRRRGGGTAAALGGDAVGVSLAAPALHGRGGDRVPLPRHGSRRRRLAALPGAGGSVVRAIAAQADDGADAVNGPVNRRAWRRPSTPTGSGSCSTPRRTRSSSATFCGGAARWSSSPRTCCCTRAPPSSRSVRRRVVDDDPRPRLG